MADSPIISAKTLGTPWGGLFDDPWPSGHPTVGERVAIFVHEVTSVDREAENIRTYHLAPVDRAQDGAVTPESPQPQGVTMLWAGCGAGTVVRATTAPDGERLCDVSPDDGQLI